MPKHLVILALCLVISACATPRAATVLDSNAVLPEQSGIIFSYKYDVKLPVVEQEGCEFQVIEQPSNLSYQFHLNPKEDFVVVALPEGTYFLRKLNCHALGVFDLDNADFKSEKARELYDKAIHVGPKGLSVTGQLALWSTEEKRTYIEFALYNTVNPKVQYAVKKAVLLNPYSLPLKPVNWNRRSKDGFVIMFD